MIHRDLQDGVAVLRMDHGKVNALDSEFLDAIRTELGLVKDSDTPAVVITGTGRVFSAGVDLVRLLDEGEPYIDGFLERLSATFYDLFTFPKPLVAAINGHAIAGGCVIACACDYRIMSEDSGNIGVPELIVGVPFPTIALEIVRSAAPDHFLDKLVATGLLMQPMRAAAHGLINEVVPDKDLIKRSAELTRELIAIPADAFALTKSQLHEPFVSRHKRLRETHDAQVAAAWKSPGTHEKIRSYLNRVLGKKEEA